MNEEINPRNFKEMDPVHHGRLIQEGIETNAKLAALHGDDVRIEEVAISVGIARATLLGWIGMAGRVSDRSEATECPREGDARRGFKREHLHNYFNQVESQVQLADTRTALLIAGNAFLLGVNGRLLQMVSGCRSGEFTVDCVKVSPPFLLALFAIAFLFLGMVFALSAALPSGVHREPPKRFFLLSHAATLKDSEFVAAYEKMSISELEKEALFAIRGKAEFATGRFGRLHSAIMATLCSIVLQACAAVSVLIQILV